MAAAVQGQGPATTEEGMGEHTQQITAPKHAGNAHGHEQGEQKQGRGQPKKPEVLLGVPQQQQLGPEEPLQLQALWGTREMLP